MRRQTGRGAARCSSSWRVWSRAFGWLEWGPWRMHLQRTPTPTWLVQSARDVSVAHREPSTAVGVPCARSAVTRRSCQSFTLLYMVYYMCMHMCMYVSNESLKSLGD